ncbi:GNAT family N-acetyltransferase [Limimaricola hongkongensis]|uniref:Ribosomal-protein-S5p-alanine acetyltransferase n=1 Tax=Limimaricola hongkongensis DSM 17492 TaxID=1122180 RepID=A0A017HAK1_9RHOB|nr:GNAT family protein [Limimaricola hongkongensis]EYD71163.1 Ribosomal-protein-S5p-alanine acetyltransferase [Limimaricola hongkongensis DSM 17492]
MLGQRRRVQIETERLTLRPPAHGDFRAWAALREDSAAFLTRWEPTWAADHLTRRAFTNRVYWAQRSISQNTALPLFLIRRADDMLLGAITLDNIRRGPAQAGTTGYWIGAPFAREGYMREAVQAVVHHAFTAMDLSRIEAGCLPENTPSRRLLESCGYKYEGVAQSYLQIDGRWRNHVLYANLRADRRGRTETG